MAELEHPTTAEPERGPRTTSQSGWKAFGPNFLAFVIGLALAYFLDWQLTDLVWTLWLSSLVVGYLTILATVAGGAYFGVRMMQQPEFDSSLRPAITLGGIGLGLFYLGFFSLHFCGFHAGHSVFLNEFFPVAGLPKDGLGAAFMNPLLLWKLVFQYLMVPYGVFLIPALIVERQHLLAPFKAPSFTKDSIKDRIQGKIAKRKRGKGLGGGVMRPYVNVIRMHILIFFFAGCHLLKIDSFPAYAVVSVVYFFPFGDLKKFRESRKVQEPDV